MRRTILTILIAGVAAGVAAAQSKRVTVTFTPQDKTPEFATAAEEYRQIWTAEGARIIEGMERVTKLKFPDKTVKVEVYEGPSFSGRGGGPMRMRASYPADEKKGTLVHELGHRMNAQLKKRPVDLDEHQLLFLYLYDLYEDLYGKAFADRQVAFGKTLKGIYDYETTWNWVLAMSREERLGIFAKVVKANGK